MATGIVTYSNGKAYLTPDAAGGVFLQVVKFNSTNTGAFQRFDFPAAAGLRVYGVLLKGGFHNWTTGVSGGVPYIQARGFNAASWGGGSGSPPTNAGFFSDVAVFAS